MKLSVFASGSSGNCTLVTAGSTAVLVDAGISCRKVTDRLRQLGVNPEQLDGILITHTHSDHICGLNVLLKKRAIPVYASAEAGEELWYKLSNLDHEQLHTIQPEQPMEMGALNVTAFATPHDAPGSLGYHFSAGNRRFAIATDLGCVQPHIAQVLDGVNAAILEANHDPDWLRDGPYPYPLQQRILGQYGHLSNEVCGELAVQLAHSGAQLLVLGHLSQENNAPERALSVVSGYLQSAGCDQVQLCVAPRDEVSGPYQV
jgi:phosphoribosyl 1,2-cyclic phosphodiesterase